MTPPSEFREGWFRAGRFRERLSAARADLDRGNAIVEFIFVAVLVLIPLVYLVAAVAVVQRSRLATTNAARDVGRAIATSNTVTQADARARAALQIALNAEGYLPSDVVLSYVAADDQCTAGPVVAPSLNPGSVFAVCVVRHQRLPAVPTVLSGSAITTIGRYVVHVDDFRTVGG